MSIRAWGVIAAVLLVFLLYLIYLAAALFNAGMIK